ncbi:MAG TPA: CGNR zinc finger domain-containing protein [Alphaproteobacteria bacterium]|nr:CGNR zinc finger domain-containing protein [Alphaproteobacteria bacterium]
MIEQTQLEASRAGTLPLIGNELALDLANTASGRGSSTYADHLQRAEHVVAWARNAQALSPSDGERLQAILAANPKLAQRLVKRTLELREAVYAIGESIAAKRGAEAAAVEQLKRVHAECLARAKLVPDGATFVWAWDPAEGPIEAVLGPVTLSALTLLTQADLTRIKQCRGDRCGWLFFDTTKNKSRRWCEMEVCGNRAKQRRFHRRRAGRPHDA